MRRSRRYPQGTSLHDHHEPRSGCMRDVQLITVLEGVLRQSDVTVCAGSLSLLQLRTTTTAPTQVR